MSKQKSGKQRGVTFQLVHRSQQDPLIADDEAPQRVLLPVTSKSSKTKDLSKDEISSKLPPAVFPSAAEEDVGMLAKAVPVSGPQLHLDPDIVAAMDEDFDYSDPENELEDNFIELANATGPIDEFNSDIGSDFEDDDGDDSLFGSEQSFEKEETKSRFTNYSVTSSVIRRNDQLRLLDEKFEKMYVAYDENEIGALDTEEIEGDVSSNLLLDSLEHFDQSKKLDNQKSVNFIIPEDCDEDIDENFVTIEPKQKWDCESILSSYSNIYNHPKKIVEPKKNKIQINKKTGIPNIFNQNTLTLKNLNTIAEMETDARSMQDDKSVLTILSQRPKEESSEERKERKQKLKEYRKERRIEKKINSLAFKDESKRQIKIAINNRNNVQGNKIL